MKEESVVKMESPKLEKRQSNGSAASKAKIDPKKSPSP